MWPWRRKRRARRKSRAYTPTGLTHACTDEEARRHLDLVSELLGACGAESAYDAATRTIEEKKKLRAILTSLREDLAAKSTEVNRIELRMERETASVKEELRELKAENAQLKDCAMAAERERDLLITGIGRDRDQHEKRIALVVSCQERIHLAARDMKGLLETWRAEDVSEHEHADIDDEPGEPSGPIERGFGPSPSAAYWDWNGFGCVGCNKGKTRDELEPSVDEWLCRDCHAEGVVVVDRKGDPDA